MLIGQNASAGGKGVDQMAQLFKQQTNNPVPRGDKATHIFTFTFNMKSISTMGKTNNGHCSSRWNVKVIVITQHTGIHSLTAFSHGGSQLYSGGASASRSKGPRFESRDDRVLPFGFSTQMARVLVMSPGSRHRA